MPRSYQHSRLGNLRMTLEKYFPFDSNCKELRVEAENGMSNCETYLPLYSKFFFIHNFGSIFRAWSYAP